MNDIDLENWEPETPKPALESMLRNVSPFRTDTKGLERKAMCLPARSRRFECPCCGIEKNVEPTWAWDEWHYHGQCSNCGQTWSNAYYMLRKCEECGKLVPVTSRNPQAHCKCQGERRPF